MPPAVGRAGERDTRYLSRGGHQPFGPGDQRQHIDGVGDGWRTSDVAADGSTIRLQPGVIGATANRLLARHGRKIGPDPASIATAKIGGIAANNASGMCCGTTQNSYHTLIAMRIILADGTLLDTSDAESRAAFTRSHGAMLIELRQMGEQVRGTPRWPIASRTNLRSRTPPDTPSMH